MADLRSVLAALRSELESAERLGRSNVEEIRAEISRTEAQVAAHVDRPAAARPGPVTSAAVSMRARAERYVTALRAEKATVAGDARREKEIDAEIARVEAKLHGSDADRETADRAPRTERATTGRRGR